MKGAGHVFLGCLPQWQVWQVASCRSQPPWHGSTVYVLGHMNSFMTTQARPSGPTHERLHDQSCAGTGSRTTLKTDYCIMQNFLTHISDGICFVPQVQPQFGTDHAPVASNGDSRERAWSLPHGTWLQLSSTHASRRKGWWWEGPERVRLTVCHPCFTCQFRHEARELAAKPRDRSCEATNTTGQVEKCAAPAVADCALPRAVGVGVCSIPIRYPVSPIAMALLLEQSGGGLPPGPAKLELSFSLDDPAFASDHFR